MDAHFLGDETATPVRGVCGLLLEGLVDDLRFVVRSDLAGSTRAWSVLEQLFNATCLVPVEPLRDRRPRYAHLPADRRPRPSLGRAENDVGFRPRVAVWSVCSPIAPSACVLLGATESYALEVAMRGIYRYLLGKRFLLHYTRTLGGTGYRPCVPNETTYSSSYKAGRSQSAGVRWTRPRATATDMASRGGWR